jgi:hypothetical protein
LKKSISFIFLSIVLLNAIGLQLFFSAYNFKINRELDSKIEEGGISAIHTIVYKMPIHVDLPYLSSKPIENDLKGELNYKGNTYRLVKSTIHLDTIYYECVLNSQAKIIKKAYSDYLIKNNNDNSDSKKGEGWSGQKVIKDYLGTASVKLPLIEVSVFKTNKYFMHSYMLKNTFLDFTVPPPRTLS